MYSGLLIILLPLIAGYLIRINHKPALYSINKLLGWMVYVILFFMGISLAFLDNLSTNLQKIFIYSTTFFIFTFGANIIALYMLERRWRWKMKDQQQILPSRWRMALDSMRLCGVVLGGFLLGLTHWSWLTYSNNASEFSLIFLLFLVGIQLRNSGMTLGQITLNKRGMVIAIVVAVSALLGGAIAAVILGLPVFTGLSIASAFGWYSLSGIVLTDAFGPVIGSTAFFNDLLRELIAIMLIPTLISRHPSIALGTCGATSMDFTLPILQRSGSVSIVPAAIVHGFLLSLLGPVLMALFSS